MERIEKITAYSKLSKFIKWNQNEKSIQENIRNCYAEKLTIQESIQLRFRNSVLGAFLYDFNSIENQEFEVQDEKLQALCFDLSLNDDLKLLTKEKDFKRKNDICEDVMKLLKTSLEKYPSELISIENALKQMELLRLSVSSISQMDSSLAKLDLMTILILAGNCLEDFSGSYLPRNLKFLELYSNCLTSTQQLMTNVPENILYLGLSRNFLTEDGLTEIKSLKHLVHLDLGNNNIVIINVITPILCQITSLTSLVLQGNPCAMTVDYKSAVLSELPRLLYLDEIKLNPEDRTILVDITQTDAKAAALQLYGIRIMSIPQPKAKEKFNKKTVIHNYHLEVECPLLDSKLKTMLEGFNDEELTNDEKIYEVTEQTEDIQNNKETSKQRSKKKSKAEGKEKSPDPGSKKKKPKSPDNNKRSKKKKPESPDKNKQSELAELESENLFAEIMKNDREIKGSSHFSSERKSWSKLISFPEPAVEIPVLNTVDLILLRDVFRTDLVVRIIYTKTIPPDKKKKQAKSKKNKLAKTKGKSKTEERERTDESDVPEQETVISRKVLAKIVIPLQEICWNTKSLDYEWSKESPVKAKLLPEIRDMTYIEGKSKKDKSKKDKKLKKGSQAGQTEEKGPQQIPKSMTCHLGVGVKRDIYSQHAFDKEIFLFQTV